MVRSKVPWSQVSVVYCITHAREVLADDQNVSENGISHYNGIREQSCRGPFTYCPPPAPLTEEEWEIITEKEYHRYASEVK